MIDPNDIDDPVTRRLIKAFPDAVDFKLVHDNRSHLEYIHNSYAEKEESQFTEVQKEDIKLEVVFDGVYAGMSKLTHTVYYYIEDSTL